MNARELRIGNLYRYLHEESESIRKVDIDFLKTQLAYDNDPEDELFCRGWWAEGIPLTEEQLVKCGGEIKPFSIGVILGRFRFIWKEAYKYWYIVASDPGGAYMTKIEFLHELQNFIWVMDGEELEVK